MVKERKPFSGSTNLDITSNGSLYKSIKPKLPIIKDNTHQLTHSSHTLDLRPKWKSMASSFIGSNIDSNNMKNLSSSHSYENIHDTDLVPNEYTTLQRSAYIIPSIAFKNQLSSSSTISIPQQHQSMSVSVLDGVVIPLDQRSMRGMSKRLHKKDSLALYSDEPVPQEVKTALFILVYGNSI